MSTATAPTPARKPAARNREDPAEALERAIRLVHESREEIRTIFDAIEETRANILRIAQAIARMDKASPAGPTAPTPAPAPARQPASSPAARRPTTPQHRQPARATNPPRTGRELYRWAADNNLIEAILEIGQGRSYPERIISWSNDQAVTAYGDLFADMDETEDDTQGKGYGY
jgi:hypothetical protein